MLHIIILLIYLLQPTQLKLLVCSLRVFVTYLLQNTEGSKPFFNRSLQCDYRWHETECRNLTNPIPSVETYSIDLMVLFKIQSTEIWVQMYDKESSWLYRRIV